MSLRRVERSRRCQLGPRPDAHRLHSTPRERSVAVRLDDPQVIQAGARAFAQQGCATCHGGPGVDYAKFAEGINPGPPELKDVAGLEPAQLFWAIKNGIRMTGMPSFEKAGVSDQDIWQIVAFVKKLPDVSDADYKTWTTQK